MQGNDDVNLLYFDIIIYQNFPPSTTMDKEFSPKPFMLAQT